MIITTTIILSYLSGSIPWSIWLSKTFYGVDPRSEADRNPGAANTYRVAGWRLGITVLVLDYLKAFIPVSIANYGLQYSGIALFCVALMPTLGHAFSVFLGFRGGRGIVVMFGVWSGLTLYQIPLLMGLSAIVASLFFRDDEWRTILIPIAVIIYLIAQGASPGLILLTSAQLLVFVMKIGIFYLGWV